MWTQHWGWLKRDVDTIMSRYAASTSTRRQLLAQLSEIKACALMILRGSMEGNGCRLFAERPERTIKTGKLCMLGFKA